MMTFSSRLFSFKCSRKDLRDKNVSRKFLGHEEETKRIWNEGFVFAKTNITFIKKKLAMK